MPYFNGNDFLLKFMSIVFEALPFIVLGAVISGVLEELLPQRFFARFLPKRRVLAIMGSSFLGVFLPMCECGIVPVMRRLMRKGVPASCAITYMLSAPIINPIVLLSTSYAFSGTLDLFGVYGLKMVLLRASGAFITAVTVGLLIDRMVRRGEEVVLGNVARDRLVETSESSRLRIESEQPSFHVHGPECQHSHAESTSPATVGAAVGLPILASAPAPAHHHDHDGECCDHDHGHDHGPSHGHGHADHHHPHAEKRTLLDRLTAVAEIALGDFLDICAFLIIGAAIASTVNTMLTREMIENIGSYPAGSIFAMMGLAVLLSLCSEADAFVAANFRGIPIAAKFAFLVLGPMLDLKLFVMYRWVFSKRAVWTIIRTLVSVILVLSFVVSFADRMGFLMSTP